MEKKNICLVAAEGVPFVKVGGMADVVGALYKYLKPKHNLYLFLPFYKKIKESYETEKVGTFDVFFTNDRQEKGFVNKSVDFPGIYFIGNDNYFERDDVYGPDGKDYPDSAERFSFFSKSVLEVMKKFKIDVHIFHCHDWHTALIPLYLKLYYKDVFPIAKTLFTIHNLGYQGVFPVDKFHILGLPWEYFNIDELEFYGNVNFMKSGIIHSEKVNTVSPKYAKEILTPEFGYNLDGLLRKYQNKLTGILNGIDYQIWNPAIDGNIYKKYRGYKNKLENKLALQKRLKIQQGKEIPVFGMISRLVEQKGIDQLLEIMENLLSLPLEIVILGDGEQKYKEALSKWQQDFPKKLSITFAFDDKLAHQIYAGSDFFLMPSKFEPCGLGQMISFKYGTVPIVRKVGGLADTVSNYNFETEEGTGFTFEGGAKEFFLCIENALKVFADKNKMERLVNKIMKLNFSWKTSIEKYLKIYEELMEQ